MHRHFAAAYGRNLECVKVLESAGAELNRDSFEGGTPLELAINRLAQLNTWSGGFTLSNPFERQELLKVAEYLAQKTLGPEKAAAVKDDWPPVNTVDPEADVAAREAAQAARDAEMQKLKEKQAQEREKAKDERDAALQEAMNRNREERAGALARTATVAQVVASRWKAAAALITEASPEPESETNIESHANSGLSNMSALVQWMNAAFEENYDEPEDCMAAGGVDLLGFFCDATGLTDKMDDDEELARSLTPTTSRAATAAGATENFAKLALAMERYLQGKEVFKSVDLNYIDVQAIVERGSDADLEAMLAMLLCCVRRAMLGSNLDHIDDLMERVSQLDDSTLAVLEDIDAAAMARATQVAEGVPPL